MGFDKTLTPGQLTPTDPPLTPLLTPYKINGKMKIKKAHLELSVEPIQVQQ